MAPAPSTAVVQFYWRPGCPFCLTLRGRLRKRRIPFEPVNIWQDPAAAERVRQATGGDETVPTVFIGPHSLVNPSVDQVEALLREVAPELPAGPGAPRRRWFRRR